MGSGYLPTYPGGPMELGWGRMTLIPSARGRGGSADPGGREVAHHLHSCLRARRRRCGSVTSSKIVACRERDRLPC